MARLFYTSPAGVPADIETREGYKSFWCCLEKGFTPPPFKIEQDEAQGIIKLTFEKSKFAETCQCRISCTNQALVFDEQQEDTDLGSICPGDQDFEVTLENQVFNEDEPTQVNISFMDASGNSSSVTAYSLATVIPQTPIGRVIEEGVLRHEVAFPLYSRTFFDLRDIVVQYQVERYVGSPNNRKVLFDWLPTGLWGTRERVHQIRGIEDGVEYGYRVRFRSTFDHASPWSDWVVLDEVPEVLEAPSISYAGDPFTWPDQYAISTTNPTNTGGETTSYAVFSGALPSGVTLNTGTGAITGTPSGVGAGSAVVRATGPGGTSDTTVDWTVAVSFLTGLVAYWKMEEASGQRNDSHVNGLHLTDNNTVTQVAGRVGNAAQFTIGNSEFLSRADEALLAHSAVFSYFGWFWLDTSAAFYTIIGKDESGQSELLVQWDGSVLRLYISSNGSTYTGVSSTVNPSTGAWHSLYVDWDGADMHISVDDGAIQSAAKASVFDGTADLNFGRAGSAGGFINGRIDEMGRWSRVLTAPQRTALFNGGAGVTYPAFA